MKPAIVAALAVALGTVCGAASAGPTGNEIGPNLVANGGFESALTGWTASGFQLLGYDYGIDSSFAHGGSSSFQGGAIDSIVPGDPSPPPVRAAVPVAPWRLWLGRKLGA